MNVSMPVRVAIGAGILGGTALLLAACGTDKPDAAGGSSTTQGHAGSTAGSQPQPLPSPEPLPSSGPVAHGADSSYGCVSRSFEIPGYTLGTARSLTSNWGGGQVRLSVQDAEVGWKYVTASACGPRDQASANLDDYDAAVRRTIADVR
jgi:hypothetical protein